MSIAWGDEQITAYQKTRAGAEALLLPKASTKQENWRPLWQACGALELTGLSIPERYGGAALGAHDAAHRFEAFAEGCSDMGLVFSIGAQLFAATMPLVGFASEELKAHYLPALADGSLIAGNAITETEAGSDVAKLSTTAVRQGDHYVLTGAKSYVSNAAIADVLVVYATTNSSFGYLGITAFLVDIDLAGISISDPLRKMGLDSCQTAAVKFDNCLVPITHRLGREGQGLEIFQHSMTWERTCLFAAYLGMMTRQLSQCIDHVQSREQFGKPIASFQAIRHTIANMKLRLEAARLLLYDATKTLSDNQDASLKISMAKLAISEAAVQSSLDAIQIFGASGYNTETGIEVMLRDAIPSRIFRYLRNSA